MTDPTVLVLGASGSIAVQIAKALGAGLVVAADRDSDRLTRAARNGADATVAITPDVDLARELGRAGDGRGFDVIIDPLWGAPALAAMHAAGRRARHIQIGQTAGATIELPAGLVRGARLEILGFAHLDPPAQVRREAYRTLTALAADGALRVDTRSMPLANVDRTWDLQQRGAPAKLVLTPRVGQ